VECNRGITVENLNSDNLGLLKETQLILSQKINIIRLSCPGFTGTKQNRYPRAAEVPVNADHIPITNSKSSKKQRVK
jgi:hypothetical protein